MAKTLDARGLACPAPVLLVKDAVEKENLLELTVMVDNEASKENVSRFLSTKNYSVTKSSQGSDFLLVAHRQESSEVTPQPNPDSGTKSEAEIKAKIFIMVAGDRMGSGDADLGEKLMFSFIKTIKEMGDNLWRLVFVNSGVKLTIDSSPVLTELQAYERNGLSILVCGTCLTHFDLIEAKKVGETTNMLDIVTAMQLADKVINIS
ncbi:MAG: sulfurtransferase-like selenium metabolism protein YedF [Desulfobulbaceae bacterium]|nr:MAG: sulfurtransferase-like selenium metabolism protein YedF [Desulfobulbaceae bacterium]